MIAGRKNTGELSGTVYVNGAPRTAAFMRQCAYIEQQDIHSPFVTVYEALNFSATLRMDASVDEARRAAFIGEVLDTLELTDVSHRLIGSLSASQLKRVSIGVELASNAPIICLDEPTSSLDSRSALRVMRVVHRLATTFNRTVIATIHQPSSELFLTGDDLLLLQTGGWQVYYGLLGRDGRIVVDFMTSNHPTLPRCAPTTNPATYMLEVLATHPQARLPDAASSASAVATAATGAASPTDTSRPALLPAQLDGDAGAGAGLGTAAVGAGLPTGLTTLSAFLPGGRRDRDEPNAIDWHTAYARSEVAARAETVLDAMCGAKPAATAAVPAGAVAASSGGVGSPHSLWFELSVVLRRTMLIYWRNRAYTLGRIAIFAVLALIEGILYFRVSSDSFGGVRSKVSVIFLSVSFGGECAHVEDAVAAAAVTLDARSRLQVCSPTICRRPTSSASVRCSTRRSRAARTGRGRTASQSYSRSCPG